MKSSLNEKWRVYFNEIDFNFWVNILLVILPSGLEWFLSDRFSYDTIICIYKRKSLRWIDEWYTSCYFFFVIDIKIHCTGPQQYYTIHTESWYVLYGIMQ